MENRKLSETCDANFGDRRPDAVEQFAASLAYGVRNPLTVIKGYLQLYHCNPAYCTQESLLLMLREAEAIEAVTGSLIAVVRQLTAEKSPQELQLLCRLLPMAPAAIPHGAAALTHSGIPPERIKKGMLKRHSDRMPLASTARAVCPGWQRGESCHGK